MASRMYNMMKQRSSFVYVYVIGDVALNYTLWFDGRGASLCTVPQSHISTRYNMLPRHSLFGMTNYIEIYP
jgi:hypothetical protein